MNVCVIIPSNKICSPNNIALAIAESLAKKNNHVTILYLKEYKDDCIVPHECLMRKLNARDFFLLNEYDVVHSHLLKPDIINAFFSFTYKNKTTKTISTIHSNIIKDLSTYIKCRFITRIVAKLWFYCLNLLSVRVVISESLGVAQRDDLKDYVVIHNGISPLNCSGYNVVKMKRTESPVRVGILTRLHPGKGIEDSFFLAEHAKYIKVIIYGSGKLEGVCRSQAENLDNLFFNGYANDISIVFKNIDILLVSSRHEGFGMTLLESIKYNTPVICYDLPVFREILGEGDFYYKNNNELLSLLNRFISSYESNRKRQAERKELFDISLMISKYEALFKKESRN